MRAGRWTPSAGGRAALAVLLLACASCAGDLFGTSEVDSLEIVPFDTFLFKGETLPLEAVARDGRGDRIRDAPVQWTSANEHIVTISVDGMATGVGTGGPILVTARSGDQSAVAQVTVRTTEPLSAPVAAMLERISTVIERELCHLRESLPLNPRREEEFLAKIALLERPTLASEVIDGRFFAEDSAWSARGEWVSIVSVYPLGSLSGEARTATRRLAVSIPILEGFVGGAIKERRLEVWQGFTLGARGGPGSISIEDQATYESVEPEPWRAYVLPYPAMLTHELGHSFFGNEGLTQFLELYTYNLLETGSPHPRDWVFTRAHLPHAETNTQVHALLDVYMLIGEEAMSGAFAAVYPLGARYGEPLSAAARQAFIDAAPPELREVVAAKIATITF